MLYFLLYFIIVVGKLPRQSFGCNRQGRNKINKYKKVCTRSKKMVGTHHGSPSPKASVKLLCKGKRSYLNSPVKRLCWENVHASSVTAVTKAMQRNNAMHLSESTHNYSEVMSFMELFTKCTGCRLRSFTQNQIIFNSSLQSCASMSQLGIS